jgi:AraC-like DNA-binding protein
MAPDDARVTPITIPENIELIEVLTGGEVFFEFDGKQRTFGKGTIFWHQSGDQTIFQTTSQAPYRCIVFGFQVTDFNRPAPRVSFWNPQADLDHFVSECQSLFHSKKLDVDILTLYIYGTLLRHAMVKDDPSSRQNYPQTLDLALEFIHRHLGKKISIKDISKHSKISQPHLFKLFQTHLNSSPHQYILSQQLARARTMLAGSQLTIKEIANECGFGNLEVFYRRFHRETGMPPGEYRQKYLPYRFSNNT